MVTQLGPADPRDFTVTRTRIERARLAEFGAGQGSATPMCRIAS